MITRRLARPLSALSSATWTCPACAKASLIQQRLPQPQRRKIHRVPPLSYDETFRRDGVPGLFSATGFQIAWTTYMGMIIQKLNDLVAGEPMENMQPKDIVIQYARDPMSASLFNHASMAVNNHFFFRGLSTAPKPIEHVPALKQSLEASFGSIETLKMTMIDTASAMFGPGFVWLVWARDRQGYTPGYTRGDWRILTTYLAGTPFPEAGYRRQGIDMNTSTPGDWDAYRTSNPAYRPPPDPVNHVGSFGAHSAAGKADAKLPPGGISLVPVLCVNTWEHAYIYDFGLPGKRKYLADWWEAIDWSEVEANAPNEKNKHTVDQYLRR